MLYDQNATTAEIESAQIDIALLPVGAIEQHSRHLPLGTDWIGVAALARRVAELLGQDRDVYLLPALPYSLSQCHGPMPGTVWLRPQTLAAVLRDTVLSLREQGIRRIVVVNGHGGNFILDSEIRELNLSYPDLIVIDSTSCATPSAHQPTGRVTGGDIHAGAGETSSQLHLSPQAVRAEHADYVPPVGREFLDYAYMLQISPQGVWGQPSKGTAELGELALERQAMSLAGGIPRAFEQIERLRVGEDL